MVVVSRRVMLFLKISVREAEVEVALRENGLGDEGSP